MCAVKDKVKGDYSPEAIAHTPSAAPAVPSPPHMINKTKTSFHVKWNVSIIMLFNNWGLENSPSSKVAMPLHRSEMMGKFAMIDKDVNKCPYHFKLNFVSLWCKLKAPLPFTIMQGTVKGTIICFSSLVSILCRISMCSHILWIKKRLQLFDAKNSWVSVPV